MGKHFMINHSNYIYRNISQNFERNSINLRDGSVADLQNHTYLKTE